MKYKYYDYLYFIRLYDSLEMVKISQHSSDQIQFIEYHKKEQNESLNQFKEKNSSRPIQNSSLNTEQLGQYGSFWPSFSVLA